MNESTYYHSVRLDKDKCTGCTNCLKRCPTEAIRVRDGKATIIGERCIDCGECIRVCPYHAKVAVTDELSSINRFKYSIALPAPTLYGQFKNLPNINRVLAGLKMMGFSAVYEVAAGADIVSHAVAEYLKKKDVPKPLISSACPAILRLIRVRFPGSSTTSCPSSRPWRWRPVWPKSTLRGRMAWPWRISAPFSSRPARRR